MKTADTDPRDQSKLKTAAQRIGTLVGLGAGVALIAAGTARLNADYRGDTIPDGAETTITMEGVPKQDVGEAVVQERNADGTPGPVETIPLVGNEQPRGLPTEQVILDK